MTEHCGEGGKLLLFKLPIFSPYFCRICEEITQNKKSAEMLLLTLNRRIHFIASSFLKTLRQAHAPKNNRNGFRAPKSLESQKKILKKFI